MIPWVLIAVGGVMILAGVKKQSPLEIIKSILTNTPIPTDTPTTSTGTTETPPRQTPGAPSNAPKPV